MPRKAGLTLLKCLDFLRAGTALTGGLSLRRIWVWFLSVLARTQSATTTASFVCSEELSIFCYRANTVKGMWRDRGQNLEQLTWLLGTGKYYWEEHSRSGNKMCLQGRYRRCLRRQRNPSPVNAWFCARGTSKWHSRDCYTLHSLCWEWTCLVTAVTKVLLYWETDSGVKLPGCAGRGKAESTWPADYSSKVL